MLHIHLWKINRYQYYLPAPDRHLLDIWTCQGRFEMHSYHRKCWERKRLLYSSFRPASLQNYNYFSPHVQGLAPHDLESKLSNSRSISINFSQEFSSKLPGYSHPLDSIKEYISLLGSLKCVRSKRNNHWDRFISTAVNISVLRYHTLKRFKARNSYKSLKSIRYPSFKSNPPSLSPSREPESM